MRKSLIAIVLFIFAAVAGAHVVTKGATKNAANAPAAVAQPAVASAARAQQHVPGLIRTSHGEARVEDELPMDDAPPVLRQGNPATKTGEQQPRRAGPAMLLAVMAVMTGIVLRRYGSRMQ